MAINYLTHLPIYDNRQKILDAIDEYQVIIISGDTGSGKTTQLPLFCLEAGREKIVCTQPRRLAAISLANYVASSLNTTPGQEVGYQVRFKEKISSATKIRFVTDGILLGEIAGDPDLEKYDTIIIDEAHERSINIDFILGYLRSLIFRRKDLKVIISSATINTRLFSRAFNNAPVITVSGRLYPVTFEYRPVIELWKGESMDSYIEGVITSVKQIIDSKENGDILIFLPTVQDIFEVKYRLEYILKDTCFLFSLHSRLPETQQQLIFKKYNKRKIVIATNIAETSITVPGIRFVIDSGLVRMLRYEPSARISRMPVERISKASADQRAGRCGRVQDGICIRLYSESDYMSRPSFTTPEILRANLASVLLKMKHSGLGDPSRFPFIQRPSKQAILSAFHHLIELGAINKRGELTLLGKQMSLLPLDPPVSRMLIYAREHDSVKEIMIIAASLSIDGPFINNFEQSSTKCNKFKHPDSDFMTLLNVWRAYNKILRKKQYHSDAFSTFCKEHGLSPLHMREWYDAYQQIRRICRMIKGFVYQKSQSSYEAIHKSLLSGFFYGLAKRSDSSYSGIHVDGISIFPSSTLARKKPQWVLFHEIVETTKVYGRTAAVIRPQWVESIFKTRCRYSYEDPWYEPKYGLVRAREEVTFQGLLLIKNRYIDFEKKDPELAQEIFIQEALVKEMIGDGYRFVNHNHQMRNRISTLQHKFRRSLYAGDWALEEFYREKLHNVKNRRELNNAIKHHGSDTFLMIALNEICSTTDPIDDKEYPDSIVIGETKCTISYLFSPGDFYDGVTINVDEDTFNTTPPFYWEWLLPVLWRPRIELIVNEMADYLSHIPINKQDVVNAVVDKLRCAEGNFVESVCSYIYQLYEFAIPPENLKNVYTTDYLWPLIRVFDKSGNNKYIIRANQNISNYSDMKGGLRASGWIKACQPYEQNVFISWDGPLLEAVSIDSKNWSVGIKGIPALHYEQNRITKRIFFSLKDASISHEEAILHLLEEKLAELLAWEIESIKIPSGLLIKYRSSGLKFPIEESIEKLIFKNILSLPEKLPCDYESFQTLVSKATKRVHTSVNEVFDLLNNVILNYVNCNSLLNRKHQRHKQTYLSSMYDELNVSLNSYISEFLLVQHSYNYMKMIPSILMSFIRRIEVAYDDPAKYRSKMKIISFYKNTIEMINQQNLNFSYDARNKKEILQLYIELFLISQFYPSGSKNNYNINEEVLQERLEDLRYEIDRGTIMIDSGC